MPIFNVAEAVVALVEAPDKETAQRMLTSSLVRHGFEPYEGSRPDLPPFESEDGTEAEKLP
jgi:hypothetical protein